MKFRIFRNQSTGAEGGGTGQVAQQQQQTLPPNNQQQQQQAPPEDPFAAIPVDNLDDATRAALEKAKQAYTGSQNTLREAQQKYTSLEGVASRYQSEAAQAQNLLKSHNLLPGQNGQNQQQQQTPEQVAEGRLYTKYKSMGLAEEQAKSFARLNSTVYAEMREDILKEVGQVAGPLARQTQSLVAQNLLTNAAQDPNVRQLLMVPEVYNEAMDVINNLVNSGTQVTQGMMDMAIHSASGKALMSGKLQNLVGQQRQQLQQQQVQQPQQIMSQPQQQQQPFMLFGNPQGQGSFQAPGFQPPNQGQLVPQDNETANAIKFATLQMDRDLGKVDHLGRPIKKGTR